MCRFSNFQSRPSFYYMISLFFRFAIQIECFARCGSKDSLPFYYPSRACYYGACSPTPRLPYGIYYDSLTVAIFTRFRDSPSSSAARDNPG